MPVLIFIMGVDHRWYVKRGAVQIVYTMRRLAEELRDATSSYETTNYLRGLHTRDIIT